MLLLVLREKVQRLQFVATHHPALTAHYHLHAQQGQTTYI